MRSTEELEKHCRMENVNREILSGGDLIITQIWDSSFIDMGNKAFSIFIICNLIKTHN